MIKRAIISIIILSCFAASGMCETETAIVLGKKISSSDIEPGTETLEKNKDKMNEKEFDRWLKQYRESRLRGLIFGTLFEKYISDNNIAATDEEVKELNHGVKRNLEKLKVEQEEYRSKLVKELETPNLDEKKKKELESRIETLDRGTERLKEERPETASTTEEGKRVIKIWKANKTLFEKYGGRVIFQQGGPEPLDAYREFLREQEKSGQFEFKDSNAADMFWNYFTNEKMHTFCKDLEKAKKMIQTPWWVNEDSVDANKNR